MARWSELQSLLVSGGGVVFYTSFKSASLSLRPLGLQKSLGGGQPRDLGPSPEALRRLVQEKARDWIFQGSHLPLPQPLPSSSPHPYPDPPVGRGGPPGPSRPSPRTPRRPTRPQPPSAGLASPADLVPAPLAWSAWPTAGRRTGRVAEALLAKAQRCRDLKLASSARLPTTHLQSPFLLPTSSCRFYSVPTPQPSKQRAESPIRLLRVFSSPQLGEGGHRDTQTAPRTVSRGHS